MKAELDELLVTRYPKIFADRFSSLQTTAMCWGFDCGDGWFPILNTGCNLIQSHIDLEIKAQSQAQAYNAVLEEAIRQNSTKPLEEWHGGTPSKYLFQWWKTAIENKDFRKVTEPPAQLVAVQVKEKFGTLRFYYDGGDSYCRGVVAMMEDMTYHTCEVCGSPGKVLNNGWVSVRCDKHSDS